MATDTVNADTPPSASDRNIEEWSAEFGAQFGGMQAFTTKYRPYTAPFEQILSAIPDVSDIDMLDIGGGDGLLLYLAARAGRLKSGICLDTNEKKINAGRAAMQALGIQYVDMQTVEGTARWPARTFDVVSMIDMLHHTSKKTHETIIREACARTKPGGVFVYKDMARKPVWNALANRLHDLVLAREWISYAPIAEVERWASENGMALILEEDLNILWYRHELRVFKKNGVSKTIKTNTNT